MRLHPVFAAALLALTGCAQTGVSLFPGEIDPVTGKQNPTGGVAVLDPENGSDVAVIDQASSQSGVRNHHVSAKAMSAEQLDARYGALLATLPQPPRLFILYFKEGTTDLVEESSALLPDLFKEVKARPGVDIQIVGHTDTVGQEADNDALSIQRAGEVKVMLSRLGLDGEIIRATGRGERELRAPTEDETPSALNRRVEVYVK
jgi:outer membrane protein OmpA-like peptidoglycan-associated protein